MSWEADESWNVGRCLYSILIDFFAPDAAREEFRFVGIIWTCLRMSMWFYFLILLLLFDFESKGKSVLWKLLFPNFVQVIFELRRIKLDEKILERVIFIIFNIHRSKVLRIISNLESNSRRLKNRRNNIETGRNNRAARYNFNSGRCDPPY